MPQEIDHYKVKWFKEKNIFRSVFQYRLNKTFFKSLGSLPLGEDYLLSDDPKEFIDFVRGKYDVIITGSDEVWMLDGYRGFPTPYWLPGDLKCKKIAYAVSSRSYFSDLSEDMQSSLKSIINDFSYISVRDDLTLKEVVKLTDTVPVKKRFDPIFMYDFNPDRVKGTNLLRYLYHIDTNKKIIALLIHDNELLKFICEHAPGCEIISLYEWNRPLNNVHNLPKISPLDLINVIAAADFVITTYFHPTCISIITGTPMYVVEKRVDDNNTSKTYDIMKYFGLLDRYSLMSEDVYQQNLGSFLRDFEKKDRLDFSDMIDVIREEFNSFGQMLLNCETGNDVQSKSHKSQINIKHNESLAKHTNFKIGGGCF